MYSADPKVATSFIRTLASKPQSSEEINKILATLKAGRLELNIFHCSAAMTAFREADGWKSALDFVHRMRSWAVLPDDLALATAHHSLGKSDPPEKWATAIACLEQTSGSRRVERPWGGRRWTRVQVNPAISTCSNCDKWQVANSILRQASFLRATLDTISYNSAFSSFASGSLWSLSHSLLVEMQDQNVQPDVITLNSAINTCNLAVWAIALQVLEKMNHKSLDITEVTCGATVKVCSSKWRAAIHLAQSLNRKSLRMNAVIGHSALASCGMCEQWSFSLQLASRLQAQDSFDCKALVATIDAMSRAKRWSLPLSLFRMHKNDCRHFDCLPFNAALAACGQGNGWASVLKLFEVLATDALVPDEVSWGTVVSGFEQMARWRHALEFIAMARSFQVETSEICINSAASSCEKACTWSDALSLLHCMGHQGTSPGSIGFNSGITACQTCSEWQLALKFTTHLQTLQIASEVSCSETAIATAQASAWPLSLSLLGGRDGSVGASWATSMASIIEVVGPAKQSLQLLATLGASSVVCLSWDRDQQK